MLNLFIDMITRVAKPEALGEAEAKAWLRGGVEAQYWVNVLKAKSQMGLITSSKQDETCLVDVLWVVGTSALK